MPKHATTPLDTFYVNVMDQTPVRMTKIIDPILDAISSGIESPAEFDPAFVQEMKACDNFFAAVTGALPGEFA